MATTLGKRKRRAAKDSGDTGSSRQDDAFPKSLELDAQEIFRRHFEAQFKPLPPVEKKVKVVEDKPEDDSEDDSEWDGISDGEQAAVQVVEHTNAQSRVATMSKDELKAYMVRLFIPFHNQWTLTRKQELKTTYNYTENACNR